MCNGLCFFLYVYTEKIIIKNKFMSNNNKTIITITKTKTKRWTNFFFVLANLQQIILNHLFFINLQFSHTSKHNPPFLEHVLSTIPHYNSSDMNHTHTHTKCQPTIFFPKEKTHQKQKINCKTKQHHNKNIIFLNSRKKKKTSYPKWHTYSVI